MEPQLKQVNQGLTPNWVRGARWVDDIPEHQKFQHVKYTTMIIDEASPEMTDLEYWICPLKKEIEANMQREAMSHLPGAWVNESNAKVGYEINSYRDFYPFTPARLLDEIETDLKRMEIEIAETRAEVAE